MKKTFAQAFTLAAATISHAAVAQQAPAYEISWSGGAQAVPLMGTYSMAALVGLLGIASLFFLRRHPVAAKAVCAVASVGLMALVAVGTRQSQALVPELEATQCSSPAPVPVQDNCGQQLRNSCGEPITVTITVTDQGCGELVGGSIKSGDVLEDGEFGTTPACVNYCA
jgi:hypothetical protein